MPAFGELLKGAERLGEQIGRYNLRVLNLARCYMALLQKADENIRSYKLDFEQTSPLSSRKEA